MKGYRHSTYLMVKHLDRLVTLLPYLLYPIAAAFSFPSRLWLCSLPHVLSTSLPTPIFSTVSQFRLVWLFLPTYCTLFYHWCRSTMCIIIIIIINITREEAPVPECDHRVAELGTLPGWCDRHCSPRGWKSYQSCRRPRPRWSHKASPPYQDQEVEEREREAGVW